jgi:hypothetical protein
MQEERPSRQIVAKPDHWEILSEEDHVKYHQLQRVIDPLSFRTSRDHLSRKFQIMINQIQRYTTRNDADDWKRQLVCGMLYLDNAIAISTRQLSKLVGRCKSSINSGFQSLGYEIVATSSAHASALTRAIPFFVRSCNEVRQWTIRARHVPVPSPACLSTFADPLQGECTQLMPEPLVSWLEAERSAFDGDGLMWQDDPSLL